MTLGRESIYHTLLTLFWQKINYSWEVIIVLQWDLNLHKIDSVNTNNIPYSIYKYDHNKGFWYYRNRCIEHSRGEIIVFIDDDEWTMNDLWLENIIQPLLEWTYNVSTSWCNIPLGQGYFTDCISLIGYPGGWALGFEKVWRVMPDHTTYHLCGGNFAIRKNTLGKVWNFEEKTIHSCDDTYIVQKLIEHNEKIIYISKSTLFHVARNINSVFSWIENRKKWLQELKKIWWLSNKTLFYDKMHHLNSLLLLILTSPSRFFGFLVIFIVFLISSFNSLFGES